MSKHLKTRVISSLKGLVSYFAPSPARSVIPARGVRYFVPVECYEAFWGAMNSVEEGRRYRKHIVVRHSPEHNGLLQLYTYHFPKTWSQACQDNRSLIKLAQRQAHALEHDYSMTGLEYRLRFFKHYFNVFRLHQDPEPGFKRYARFYQYTFVAIYRELKAAYQAAKEPALPTADEITIDPIKSVRSLQAHSMSRSLHSDVIRRSLHSFSRGFKPPLCERDSIYPVETFFCGWGTQKYERGAPRFQRVYTLSE